MLYVCALLCRWVCPPGEAMPSNQDQEEWICLEALLAHSHIYRQRRELYETLGARSSSGSLWAKRGRKNWTKIYINLKLVTYSDNNGTDQSVEAMSLQVFRILSYYRVTYSFFILSLNDAQLLPFTLCSYFEHLRHTSVTTITREICALSEIH